jgi:hypothetical protein
MKITVGTKLRDIESGIVVTVEYIEDGYAFYRGTGLEGHTHLDHITEFFTHGY